MRPQYLQVVGTNSGRLASRNPNAQNFTPLMKPYVRPADGRCFVHADLSQAELRYLAQVAEDHALRAAFDMLAVGDLRNRLIALADDTARPVRRVLQTRLPKDARPEALARLLAGKTF